MWKGHYIRGKQQEAEGAPQGFVRMERDGVARYRIQEYVDGMAHGHGVVYDSAGTVECELDYLRGHRQG